MSDARGTVELLLGKIATILSPLGSGLRPENAPRFFASLGIAMTPARASALGGSFSTTINDLDALIQIINQLTVETDESRVIEKGIEAAIKLVRTIGDFAGLASALAGEPGVTPAVVNALPERLFNLLLADFLGRSRGLNELLEFAGILQREDFNVDSTDPSRPFYTVNTFHFDRIGGWLTNPGAQLTSLYDWGTPGFDGRKILPALDKVIAQLGLPAHYDESGPTPTLDLVGIEVVPKTDVSPKGLALRLKDKAVTAAIQFDGADWTITIGIEFGLLAGTEIVFQPNGAVTIRPPDATTASGRVNLGYKVERPGSNPVVLLGKPGGSRLEMRKFEVNLGAGFTWDGTHALGSFSIGGALTGGKLAVSFDETDGFIGKILAGVHIESDFDFGMGYSTDHGLYFTGSSTLAIQLPLHLDLGPVEISALTFSVGIQGQKFPTFVAVDINAALGPLQVAVEQIGLEVDFALKGDRTGNAGPLDISLGFKPPRGAGLSIDTGVVKGGGYLFFDPDKGEYAGVAELSIAEIVTVKAIGLITTKMPDGSPGFSLLIIISAEFTPIQLGFGFTLVGVGGLLGLNRAVLLDVLRDGVRTGAINSIMFPANIVANAPRIISDLKAVFPPQQGVFLVGPMAKFGWGTPSLVTLSLGVIVEIPPGNIAILGVLKVALPDEDTALIQIQVSFAGILDFDKQMLSFDASLFDSHVLFLTLQGDMAVRLKWGDNAGFLLSVGGFHPSFHPPPLDLPALNRLRVTILDYPFAQIWVQCYFAVTSNTVQFGAQAHLLYGTDDFNVHGDIGFDVLFQFSPFYFNATISGSLGIEVFGAGLLSIDLRLMLEGPTPWHANGTGSISILFFSIDVNLDVTWGEQRDTSLPPVDVIPVFVGEIGKQQNWKALPPPASNLLVSLRQLDPALLVLHPFGALTVSQRAIPLNLTLEKFGNQKPDDAKRIDISAAATGGSNYPLTEVDESFAAAQFQQMSDADKLSRPSYQQLKGGVTIGAAGGPQSSKMTRRTIDYHATIIDKEPVRPVLKIRAIAGLFHNYLTGAAVTSSPLSFHMKSQLTPYPDKIAVGSAGYTVASTQDNKALDAHSSFSSEAMAIDSMRSRLAADASLSGSIHVLPNHEVTQP